jgi:hypothetical protein
MCQASSSSREGQRSLITLVNGMHRHRPSQCASARFNACPFRFFRFTSHRTTSLGDTLQLHSFAWFCEVLFILYGASLGVKVQSRQGPTAEVLAKVELVVRRNSFCTTVIIHNYSIPRYLECRGQRGLHPKDVFRPNA